MPRSRTVAPNVLAALGAALAAFAICAGLREAGALERIDLALDDGLTRAAVSAGADDRFVIVLESESDLARWGFPLSDEVLARLIERLLAAQPLAVAIDKYRDRPVAPGTERLNALLARNDRIFWVAKFGANLSDMVPAPRALDPRFVGCGDLVDDPDGNVRRALLYLDQEHRVCYSLGFQLARHAVAARGLQARFAQDGTARLDWGNAVLRAIDPGDGPYATADTAGFQVAVPSAAGIASMAQVGLTEVLEGRIPAEKFRGRIVLFGSSADSLRDFFNIPLPSAPEGYRKVPGVQVHAFVASYLLRAAHGEVAALRLAPSWASLAITAFVALLGGVLGCSRRRPWRVACAGAVVLVLYAAASLALAAYGVHLAPAAPVMALALAIAAGIARSAWLDNRERADLMLIFSRHVSREVADALWERRDKLISRGMILPRTITATVLFVDIRGFTAVFEQLPAERAVPWLNRGLAAMTEEIMRRNGVVARFIGDSIMAVFGAPVPRTTEAEIAEDAFNAIRAGLATGSALEALNREFSAEGLPPMRVRIGINTGTLTQCSVGTSLRMEFTVLGDAVNIASRLESFAMHDDGATARVLIGEETMRLAGARFETRSVGSMALKGKAIPVALTQVLSVR